MAVASQFFPLCSSPQWNNKPTISTTSNATSFSLKTQFKPKGPKLSPLQVSLSDPQTAAITDQQYTQTHNPPRTQARKNSIWINPNSKRTKEALLAWAQQPDSRLIRLTGLASSLDESEPSDQAVSAILSSQTSPISEADAVLVIDNMVCAGNAVFALRWFLKNIQINKMTILYNVTFKALRKAKNWSLVESLWEEMLALGTKPDSITFSTIISCAQQCNLAAKAIEWSEKMPRFGYTPDTCIPVLMASYWHAGLSDKTLELYNEARTKKGRLLQGALITMIVLYAGSGNFDGALNVFEEMKALGLKPNLVTYNVLLDAMHKAGRPWQVKTIYTEMSNNAVIPNRSTYVALIRAYSKGRYSKDALDAYQKMKETGAEVDVTIYNMLLSMCADIGLVEEAEEIFDEMKKLPEGSRPDSWSYTSLITAYSCSGWVSKAEQMLNEMKDAGFRPSIFVLTSLIQCYGIAKQTDRVVQVIDMLSELEVKPDDKFCGCLLSIATNTPPEELGKIINCIDSVNPNVGSFVKLLLDKNSSVQVIRERATELLDTLEEEVKKPYCNCFMDICTNYGQTSQAHELFHLAVQSKIYYDFQEKQEKQWILQVKGLSYGAALTAMYAWMDDVAKFLHNGEKLPPVLGIHTGHGKHRYGEKKLFLVLRERLGEMNAPFHEAPDKPGWLLTTDVAAKSWIEGAKKSELAIAV